MGICTRERIIISQAGFYEEVQTERQQYNKVKVILTKAERRCQTRSAGEQQ